MRALLFRVAGVGNRVAGVGPQVHGWSSDVGNGEAVEVMLRSVWGGVGGAEEEGSDLQNVGPFGGPKGVEKTPVDAVYRVDSFCRRFWSFQGGQDGRKALVQSAHGSWIPRRSAGRRNMAIWGLLGGQVGPFWGPKWVRRALWGTNLAKEKKRLLRGAFRRVP